MQVETRVLTLDPLYATITQHFHGYTSLNMLEEFLGNLFVIECWSFSENPLNNSLQSG